MDDHSTSKLFQGLAELGQLVARAERACEYTHNLVRQQHDIVAAFQGMIDFGDTPEEAGGNPERHYSAWASTIQPTLREFSCKCRSKPPRDGSVCLRPRDDGQPD